MTEQDPERTSVRTYVPAYQKEEWATRANELEMSLSEFVRTMVQAGKRGFEGGQPAAESRDREKGGSGDATPGGQDLETTVLDALENGPLEFDELVDVVAEDFRRDVDEALGRLEEEDRVEHDRLDGGYRVTDDG
ncbi:hypothetical protein L593_14605 [Salinarchaeum sp. Harcht-Bsk1]|uniref:DUF5805 domain-containing protein n=1 Tax=Salinarchaeum sp. Harcht-Bsk1 TaxID=1333523 RepID=UPI0003424517|nr:DUF5805 domain-containing protein [Salinarchaeum sp. Harcht-Bsk1]AGN02857.1 hypothetical protein L593_14605 [Salinarchaeum sp. Harcht-Bsk1]